MRTFLWFGVGACVWLAACNGDKVEDTDTLPSTSPEDCANGADDDGDGDEDCADADCVDDPACETTGGTDEDCSNGADDDGDGDEDCADADCAGDPACDSDAPPVEDLCGDTLDNDGDTLVDCADPDCAADAVCLPESNCNDGLDDDSDLAIDCLDTDCAANAVCLPESNCADGLDDDSDLATDCLDTDCVANAACLPEANCNDGLDDDSDLAIDCLDTDCVANAVCLPESNCTDGLDDDSDLAIDCLDTDCAANPVCLPESSCSDGLDDDSDGATDCDDTDCALDGACILQGCADDFLSNVLPSQYNGTTAGAGDDLVGSCTVGSTDVALQFTAPADGTYAFDTQGSAYDTAVFVLDGCGGAELDCNDDITLGLDTDSVAVVDLTAGQTVIVVVDGFSAASAGLFELHATEITGIEQNCSNGTDGDGDFLIDCADNDCDGTPTCIETQCSDAFDNELDGYADCFDSDCFADAGCFEDCSNLIDDNGDGALDCLAASCASDPACVATCAELSLGVAVPGQLSGSTLGLGDAYQASCLSTGFPTLSSDVTVEFTAPADGRYGFTVAADFLSVLTVLDTCAGPELACADFGLDTGEGVAVDLVAGQTVVVVVDGEYINEAGDFDLFVDLVSASELVCDDASDDDLDGDIDCFDSDCAADPSCLPVCPDLSLGAAVPASVSGTTVGRPDEDVGSCEFTGVPASDVSVDFTAPATGDYAFTLDPIATDFDSVLYALNGCGAPNDIACDDTFGIGNGGGEVLILPLVAGQNVVIVVDGYAGQSGNFQLDAFAVAASETACSDDLDEDFDGDVDCQDSDCSADPACNPVCPELDLGSAVPGSISGSTFGESHDERGSCDGSFIGGASDVGVGFTAPADGDYAFLLDPAGTTFDAVLYVDDGCGGPELACDDAIGVGGEGVVVSLLAGQAVTVYVDGFTGASGDFKLDVVLPPANEMACGDGLDEDFDGLADCYDSDCAADATCLLACAQTVVPAVPFNTGGSTVAEADDFTPSCTTSSAPDYSFEFTAPATALYTMSLAGSSYDTVLYVTDGCYGTELACNDDFGGLLQSELSLNLVAGQTVTVVVDGYSANAGAFTLDIQ